MDANTPPNSSQVEFLVKRETFITLLVRWMELAKPVVFNGSRSTEVGRTSPLIDIVCPILQQNPKNQLIRILRNAT